MRRFIPQPSLATAVSLLALALAVAVSGTAVAVAPTIVNIKDGTGNYLAGVNALGDLRTQAFPTPPRFPVFNGFYVSDGSNNLVGPTQAIFSLTSLTFENYYDNTVAARFYVYLGLSTTSTCSGATSNVIGAYDVAPGQTFHATFPTGLLLKPSGTGYWCLIVTVSLKGSPSSYYYPFASYSGYLISGSLSSSSSAQAQAISATPPRK